MGAVEGGVLFGEEFLRGGVALGEFLEGGFFVDKIGWADEVEFAAGKCHSANENREVLGPVVLYGGAARAGAKVAPREMHCEAELGGDGLEPGKPPMMILAGAVLGVAFVERGGEHKTGRIDLAIVKSFGDFIGGERAMIHVRFVDEALE